MIRVKRNGEHQQSSQIPVFEVLDIPIKEAQYGDKVLSVDEKMEEIWDDVLFLDHFAECSVLSLSLSLTFSFLCVLRGVSLFFCGCGGPGRKGTCLFSRLSVLALF